MAAGIAACASMVASCGDPGFGLWARNDRSADVIVRSGTDKWLLPAHSSGIVFATLGVATEADARDYDILDATSCSLIATQRVDWVANGDPVIVVGPSVSVDKRGTQPLNDAQLSSSERCPGPDDGWLLWVANTSSDSVFLESRDGGDVQTAPIKGKATTFALGGGPTLGSTSETSVIELYDASCRLLDTQTRSGWGPFKATIDGRHLVIEKGLSPPPKTTPNESSSFGDQCAAGASPTVAAGRWRVDVVNGPRPIIIRFSPALDSGLPSPTMANGQILEYAWQVEANARLTLFDQPTVPSAGSFDLLQAFNDPSKLDHCHVFQTVPFSAESFTIVLTGATLGPDYSATIEPGLPPLHEIAPYPDVTVANCSG